jgi:UDP-glucose 4-epimerase
MRILVTGSAGHLGEALVRTLRGLPPDERCREVVSADLLPSPFTTHTGDLADRSFARECMAGVDAVIHCATLHKPHVATHTRQAFVDANITATLNLLEEATAREVRAFLFTSTTSTFGDALTPPADAPAIWITEEVAPVPKNIYGVTKVAAENLCELFHKNQRLNCLVLRTSRFFPEEDDLKETRDAYESENAKANEYLYRRVDTEDVVSAHLLALDRAASIGFGRYIISATTPFSRADLTELRCDAPAVVRRLFPRYEEAYARLGWKMFPSIDRVYVNEKARRELGWQPRHDFGSRLSALASGADPTSELSRLIGAKGYHRAVG